MMHFIKILGFLIITQIPARAQDFKSDVTKINVAYKDLNLVHINVTYNLYKNHISKILYKSDKGEVIKKGKKQLYRISTVEMLTNEKYCIMTDKNTKLLVVSDPVNIRKQYLPIDLDTTMKLFKSIEFFKVSESQYGYKLKFDFTDYEEIDFCFNPKSFFIEKLTIYQRSPVKLDPTNDTMQKEKPRMEIIYKYDTKPQEPDAKIFSEKNY